MNLRFFAVMMLLLLVAVAVVESRAIRRSTALQPAKDAVLAMTVDTAVDPITLPAQKVPPPTTPPNIVLIVADDLGWRDVGFNHSEIATPNLDTLAGRGIRLNRFYVHPSCTPTRAALMTGKSPVRMGIFNPLSKNNPRGLPLHEHTLADYLRDAGYETALAGKWHLGARDRRYHPNARGFDHFYGHLTGGVGYWDKVHGGGYDWQRNGKTVRDERYATHLVADEAVARIRQRDTDKPLFMYVAFAAPHLPNEAPQTSLDVYESIADKNRRAHAAMVSEMDRSIGRVHDALIEAGIEDSTLLWFLSDNGGLIVKNPARFLPEPLFSMALERVLGVETSPVFSEFTLANLRDGGSDNGPFRGGKMSADEGGVRVPSFVFWPGVLKPDSYDYMATVQDVLPTLLEIGGVAINGESLDGQSLWTPVQSNTPAPHREYVVKTGKPADALAAYRFPYKLIDQDGKQRLYNLLTDPLENHDLVDSEPDVLAGLQDFLTGFPVGDSIALPLESVVADPDYFGGIEDREPWAEQAY